MPIWTINDNMMPVGHLTCQACKNIYLNFNEIVPNKYFDREVLFTDIGFFLPL